jgi:hypothetical protein
MPRMSLVFFSWEKGPLFPTDMTKLDTYVLYPWSAIVNVEFSLLKEAKLFEAWSKQSDIYIYFKASVQANHRKALAKFLDDMD